MATKKTKKKRGSSRSTCPESLVPLITDFPMHKTARPTPYDYRKAFPCLSLAQALRLDSAWAESGGPGGRGEKWWIKKARTIVLSRPRRRPVTRLAVDLPYENLPYERI
jgi:hypothetical protein